jgi:hypothetical protein
MPQNYTIRMRDGTVTTVQDVESETVVQQEVYDLTNYRDIVDAAFKGAALVENDFELNVLPSSPDNPPTGDLADGIISTGPSINFYSISDNIAKIPPRNEAKKRSRLKLWSEAGGTGDCLFAGWLDRIEAYSTGVFTRV